MSKDKGPDIKILRELMTESGTQAAESCEGVSQVLDCKVEGDVDKGAAEISVYIHVLYGYKIPTVSWDVQSAVKTAVKNAAGCDVKKIDIYIQGVAKKEESDQVSK